MTDKTILITGGLGFIGQALFARLLETGHNVRILDNLSNASTTADDATAAGVNVRVGDIRDRSACDDAVDGVDGVIHLAAQTSVLPSVEAPEIDLELNGFGTLNILSACNAAGVRRVVCASSNAVVGLVEPPIHELMMPAPVSPYGATKLLAESYCRTFSEIHGMHANALRFANIYGPRSKKKGRVVAKFIKDAFAGQPLTIYGGGNQTRDFLYIDDLIDGVLACLEMPRGGDVICLGSGKPATVHELAIAIQGLYFEWCGNELVIDFQPARAGEIERNYTDPTKARDILNFQANTHLDEGLRKTWEWFTKNMDTLGLQGTSTSDDACTS